MNNTMTLLKNNRFHYVFVIQTIFYIIYRLGAWRYTEIIWNYNYMEIFRNYMESSLTFIIK